MPQADLTYERFAATLAAFPDTRHLELQGEGESLMHPRFLDMVAAARARDIRVSFITNGSYFRPETPETIERLLDLGVEKISVSLESPVAEEFRAIRGGTLDKVRRGVEALMQARHARGLARPVVGLSITVLRSTRRHLPAIVALYEELGLDGGMTLQALQRMPTYARNYDAAMEREAMNAGEAEAVWVKFLSNRAIRRLQAARVDKTAFYDELMQGWRPGLRRCPWLERGVYVNHEGWVTPCCMIKDTTRHALGQIGVDAPEAMTAARERLRVELATGRIPAPCEGCDLADYATVSTTRLVQLGVKGLWHRFTGRLED